MFIFMFILQISWGGKVANISLAKTHKKLHRFRSDHMLYVFKCEAESSLEDRNRFELFWCHRQKSPRNPQAERPAYFTSTLSQVETGKHGICCTINQYQTKSLFLTLTLRPPTVWHITCLPQQTPSLFKQTEGCFDLLFQNLYIMQIFC